MANWDQDPVVKPKGWEGDPIVDGRARAAQAAAKRSASTPGFVRSIGQGFTFGFGDELDALSAGAETAVSNAVKRIAGKPVDYTAAEARDAVLASERAAQKQYQKSHPVLDTAAQVVGGVPTFGGSYLHGAQGARQIIQRGAQVGALGGGLYGLGTAEGNAIDRIPAALSGAAVGGLVGGAIGKLTSRGAPNMTAASRLASEGVVLTPGQHIGGFAKTIEDRAMGTIPILGDAIRGARIRGNESLNRAVANRALKPLNETIPANVSAGNDTVAYVRNRLNQAYNQALGQVQSVTVDRQLVTGLQQVKAAAVDLPEHLRSTLDNIVSSRVLARLQNGPINGSQLKDIQSQIKTLASDYGSSTDGGGRTLGRLLDTVSDELLGLASRNSQDGGAALRQANAGYANYVRLRNASGKLGTESGVFTPAQLRNAVRVEDNSVAKGRFAAGESLLYDLADDAASVMSSKVPDSGTAGRIGLGALGAITVQNPAVGIPTIAGLTAAAAPYLALGRATPQSLQRILNLAKRSASIGRATPKAVRDFLADAVRVLGYQHPFVRQLQQAITAGGALADDDDQSVSVESVGDMSVADYLAAQQARGR